MAKNDAVAKPEENKALDAEALVQKALEEAEQKAQEMIKAAEQKAAEILAKAEEAAAPVVEEPAPVRMVPVKLFYDGDKYKKDVYVSVNGQRFQIQRGVEVMVPHYVAEVLESSILADTAAQAAMDRMQAEYEAATKAQV